MEALIPNEEPELLNELATLQIIDNEHATKETFKPNGAIAFFILLILLCAAVWYGIYFLMLQRN